MSSRISTEPLPAVATATASASASAGSAWSELFKARLTALVVLTTTLGFYFGARDGLGGLLFWETILATGFLASGAAALNQYLEREADALMTRTRNRPLPSGRVSPVTALQVGVALSMVGMLWLTFRVNALTGLLGTITLGSYLFVYTPLKRVTTLNTLVGAVPGALPPLMGWTAATGDLGAGGWALFTILFFWQVPHFMAIAWMYRDDYAKGGFRMLPVVDPEGRRTGMTAVRHTVALMAFSLTPVALGLAGRWYAGVALALGLAFLACAVVFAARLTRESARRLFLASIVYLPVLLSVLVADRTPPVAGQRVLVPRVEGPSVAAMPRPAALH